MKSNKKVQPISTIQVMPNIRYEEKWRIDNSATSAATSLDSKKTTVAAKRPISWHYIKKWFMQNLCNYCNTTSLHGFTYITRSDLTFKERFFWICIVIVSIIVSAVLVIVSVVWNRETATVTVIESSHHPTWNIPFPAITFCNFNKISRKEALSLVKVLQRPPNTTEEEVLKTFRIVMYFSFALNPATINFTLAAKILELNNMTLMDLSKKLSPNCLSMVSKCVWKGTNTRCDSLFQRINTIEGNCCAFNYFALEKNHFPEKIAYQIPKQPYHVTGCGYPTGLSISLNPLTRDYFGTYFSSYGFRLMLHNSIDFPDENAETKLITSTRETFVRVIAESDYATQDVKDMDVKVRQCLFANERKLSAMKYYSFANCISECRVAKIMERCGCVLENLPNNGSYPVCDIKDIKCVLKNKGIFSRALIDQNNDFSRILSTDKFSCNCLPDCETYYYFSEVTMGKINVMLPLQQHNSEKTANEYDKILLHVFYSDLMSVRYRTDIFQNWLSALASFGGLLGLIMGFSIVTAFEFIYFLTFRPVFNYLNQN